jgi:hypothetical protein
MENLSQNEQIRKHLESGKTITPLEALQQFDCLRLAARIEQLKKAGLEICKRLVEKNGKRFAEYSLPLRQPSELSARTQYETTAKLMQSLSVAIVAVMLFGSCATMKPKSKALQRNTRLNQQEIQYEHSVSSGNDPLRVYRHGWNAPKKMTRIPLTQLYIF